MPEVFLLAEYGKAGDGAGGFDGPFDVLRFDNPSSPSSDLQLPVFCSAVHRIGCASCSNSPTGSHVVTRVGVYCSAVLLDRDSFCNRLFRLGRRVHRALTEAHI